MNVPSSRVLLPALLVGIAGFVPVARAGGWGIVTLDDLPDHFVAGEPIELAFTARAHGVTPVSSFSAGLGAASTNYPLEFLIVAMDGEKSVVHGTVRAETAPGRYRAQLTLPHAGDWKITVRSRDNFPWLNGVMPSTRVIDAGDGAASPPAPLSAADRGRRLFVAKGCVGCHVHDATRWMVEFTAQVGPNLTAKHLPEAYLASFLADPASFRSSSSRSWEMPNLGLQPHEISALVAFLNAGN